MSERPFLAPNMKDSTFRDFYYLKEELVDFCRKQGLQTAGSKTQLTDRISHYLNTGEKSMTTPTKSFRSKDIGVIARDTLIETPFICSEKHRVFFRNAIG